MNFRGTLFNPVQTPNFFDFLFGYILVNTTCYYLFVVILPAILPYMS